MDTLLNIVLFLLATMLVVFLVSGFFSLITSFIVIPSLEKKEEEDS